MTESVLTVFTTKYWRVILQNNDQTYLGRAVVVCQRRVGSLPELSSKEWEDLKGVMTVYEDGCRQAFGATMFNWTCLMNEAYQSSRPNPQVHWHVRPRYDHPVTFAGQEFIDEEFGHHYARQTNRQVGDDVAREMITALKTALQT